MEIISAKEARENTDNALTTVWIEELEKIGEEIEKMSKMGGSCVRVVFHYGQKQYLEVAQKAIPFFETLGFKCSNPIDNDKMENFWFTISW